MGAAFFPAVVNSNRLKSFSEVFGTPKRSLQVVERVVSFDLLVLALMGGIDVLLPKLSVVVRIIVESPFNGVDVLKLGVSLVFDLLRLDFIDGKLLRRA